MRSLRVRQIGRSADLGAVAWWRRSDAKRRTEGQGWPESIPPSPPITEGGFVPRKSLPPWPERRAFPPGAVHRHPDGRSLVVLSERRHGGSVALQEKAPRPTGLVRLHRTGRSRPVCRAARLPVTCGPAASTGTDCSVVPGDGGATRWLHVEDQLKPPSLMRMRDLPHAVAAVTSGDPGMGNSKHEQALAHWRTALRESRVPQVARELPGVFCSIWNHCLVSGTSD